MNAPLDIERRVALALAVGRYLRSAERFNQASHEFSEACQSLRQQLGSRQRLVAQVDWKHYLVTSDQEGNFEVELVETI